MLGVYPFSSGIPEKFGFYFISSLKGASSAQVRAFFGSLGQLLEDALYYFLRGIDSDIYSKCAADTMTAKMIVGLRPKIVCGVLVDKPLHILIARDLPRTSKLVSLNESFFFPPNRSFDFSHLDRYYSMNEIDQHMQNKYGGEIKSFKNVEFFRKGGNRAKGISNDLMDIARNYRFKIVLTPAQVFVEKTGFYYWAYDEMEAFLEASLKLARSFPDTLFIVKGKKGELHLLPEWFKKLDYSSDNIFVIHCDKPKDLEYNQFEDLMDIADLSISMALTSTTIWQTIARGKPAIAINRTGITSALTDYPGYECDLNGLRDAISHWQSLTPAEIEQSTATMREDFNIGECRGLEQISFDLENLLHDEPAL